MRKGDTILFEAPPSAVAYAAVGGKKEAEGPLADAVDMLIADTLCGEKPRAILPATVWRPR